jgi:hypothetical protein
MPFAMICPISGYPKNPGQPQNGVPEPSAFPPEILPAKLIGHGGPTRLEQSKQKHVY